MNDNILRAAVYSAIAALLVGFITAIRGYGSLETELSWVKETQVKMLERIDIIGADVAQTKTSHYTELDAQRDKSNIRRDQDRILKKMDSLERNIKEQNALIGNIIVQIVRRHSEFDVPPRERSPKDIRIQEFEYEY